MKFNDLMENSAAEEVRKINFILSNLEVELDNTTDPNEQVRILKEVRALGKKLTRVQFKPIKGGKQ